MMLENGTIRKIYQIVIFVFLLISLFMFLSLKPSVYTRDTQSGYEILDMRFSEYLDKSSNADVKQYYSWHVRGVKENYSTLMFYTIHQNVEVYVAGNLIYRAKPEQKNGYGNTLGSYWNVIPLTSEDNEKELVICITPSYKEVIKNVPVFLFGDKTNIYSYIVLTNILAIVFGTIAVVGGMFFISFSHYQRKNQIHSDDLYMLGLLGVELGLWKITDCRLIQLIFPNEIALTFLPYFLLMSIPIPTIMYIKSLSKQGDTHDWYVVIYADFAVMLVNTVLQIMNVKSLRETLIVTQIMLACNVFFSFYKMVKELIKGGLTTRIRQNLIGLLAAISGLLLDIVIYYVFNGRYPLIWGMLGFILFLFLLGIGSVNEARELIKVGEKAQKYEQLAYHDQLTGLYNRAAYVYETSEDGFEVEHTTVVVFDLNDLKYCNDHLGHEKGDVYIGESARMIATIFGQSGKVFRMGGDEFTCVLQNHSDEAVRNMMNRLQEATDKWNAKSPDIQIHIAVGFGRFDNRLDHDLADTMRRADKRMYANKIELKKKYAVPGSNREDDEKKD